MGIKILVISYDEINNRKSNQEVLNDIASFYENASSDLATKWGAEFKALLGEIITMGAEIEWADTHDESKRQLLPALIKKLLPDVLISYNLAGFEWTTLTDGLGYNLIPCKQIHIIEQDYKIRNDNLNKIKGINLFIYKK